jgi:hypothetical protein
MLNLKQVLSSTPSMKHNNERFLLVDEQILRLYFFIHLITSFLFHVSYLYGINYLDYGVLKLQTEQRLQTLRPKRGMTSNSSAIRTAFQIGERNPQPLNEKATIIQAGCSKPLLY